MNEFRWWVASVVGALAVVMGASIALAANLDDGDYKLTLPGIGDFYFTVDADGDETVSPTENTTVAVAPDGYVIDDDDPDKVAWKHAASLEVEVKTDKVEADVNWSSGDGKATLSLPGGGSVIVSNYDDSDGSYTVATTGNWWAVGSESDWYVANADVTALGPDAASKWFKVEATSDGVEIIAVDGPDEGFLNDLEDEEEDEAEIEEEEEEEEEEDEEEEEEEEDEGGPPSDN